MTASTSAQWRPALRTLAFGDLQTPLWGVAWIPGPGDRAFVALGAGAQWSVPGGVLHADGDGEDWRLEGEDVELSASATGAAVADVGADGSSGFDQLCQVRGRVVLDGAEREIDCAGRRGLRGRGIDLERFDSVRDVSAWFGPADGVAVVALRPRKARGQDADLVTAALFDSAEPPSISDPRLSTTYTAAGQPLRAGVELWVGDEEKEQYARRAIGEAFGEGAAGAIDSFDVHAQPFRWQSHGREGPGIYLLAQRA